MSVNSKAITPYHREMHNQLYFDTAKKVSVLYSIDAARLTSAKTRRQPIAEARQLIMYILRSKHHINLEEIGCMMDRDHTTVMHAVREIEGRIEAGQMRCGKQLLQQLINQQ